MKKFLNDLKKGNALAKEIIQKLENSDIDDKLELLEKLDELPPLPSDDRIYEYKEFTEAKESYKQLYKLSARAIIEILGSDLMHGRHDPGSSFNYEDPAGPIVAAKHIQNLPKAYMGGPIKAAIQSPYKKVNELGVNYYDSLPKDLKYSETFPDPIRKKIRTIRQHIQ